MKLYNRLKTRHGTKTIVITTPAAADAMLAHLEQSGRAS